MVNLPPALSVSEKVGAGPPPGSVDEAVMPTAVPLAAPSNTLLAAPLLSAGADGATSVTPIENADDVVSAPLVACTVMP